MEDVLKNALFLFTLSILYSCGNAGQDIAFSPNSIASTTGIETLPVGVDFADISSGLACATGGVSIFSFYDNNSDHFFQEDEDIIKTKVICNGTNASISLESIVSSATCPSGGVKIQSSTSSPVEVCNGVDGLNGSQGIQGVQGIPGIAGAAGEIGATGAAGTVITPVKFCPTDNSFFAEYGLMIGNDLYAVFWGVTPGSPSSPQASLVKLIPGNYMSTGGNNCLFTIH